MAVIGVLARVDVTRLRQVSLDLERLPGVSLFSVDEEERIGILVERRSLAGSHAALKEEVEAIPGLLGAWPVFSYADDDGEPNELTVENTHSVEADVDG